VIHADRDLLYFRMIRSTRAFARPAALPACGRNPTKQARANKYSGAGDGVGRLDPAEPSARHAGIDPT